MCGIKNFRYKIQQVFDIKYQEGLKDVKNIFKTINPRTLNYINFLDEDYKTIYNTNDFIMWSFVDAPQKTMKEIKEVLKKYPKVRFVELYKK